MSSIHLAALGRLLLRCGKPAGWRPAPPSSTDGCWSVQAATRWRPVRMLWRPTRPSYDAVGGDLRRLQLQHLLDVRQLALIRNDVDPRDQVVGHAQGEHGNHPVLE